MLNIINNLSPDKYAKLIEFELCVKMNYVPLFRSMLRSRAYFLLDNRAV